LNNISTGDEDFALQDVVDELLSSSNTTTMTSRNGKNGMPLKLNNPGASVANAPPLQQQQQQQYGGAAAPVDWHPLHDNFLTAPAATSTMTPSPACLYG